MRKNLVRAVPAFGALCSAFAFCGNVSAQDKLSVVVPIHVKHQNPKKNGHWNEGDFQNLGVVVEYKMPVTEFSSRARLYVGPVAGFYKNSNFKMSALAGGVAEAELDLGRDFKANAGTPFVLVSGYKGLRPAIAPYVGVEKDIAADRAAAGLRFQYLPSRSLGGHGSDSYSISAVVSLRL